jgi:branched-chain amino acid transport system permease protein
MFEIILLQSLASGILMGGIYALLGVGFSLTWGVMRVINIAHAGFGVLAAYIAYSFLEKTGLDPLFSLLISLPCFFLGGMFLHRGLIRPITKARETIVASMVLTFGLAIVVENIILSIWKADPRVLKPSYSGTAVFIGEVGLPIPQLIGFGLAAVGILLLYLFLNHTHTGKAVQATWQEKEGAALMGINLQKVSEIAFGLAIAAAGLGGVAMAMMYTFDPPVHNFWLIYMFLVVIVGRVGSILGTAVAGLILGVITGLCMAFIPYQWINVLTFGLLIVVLLVRPQGLFKTGV